MSTNHPQSAAAAQVPARDQSATSAKSTTPADAALTPPPLSGQAPSVPAPAEQQAPSPPPSPSPLPLPPSALPAPSPLDSAKSLALARLNQILADPESSPAEARLAAAIVLRYAVASEPRPRATTAAAAAGSSPTVREGSPHESHNATGTSTTANHPATPAWLDKYEREEVKLFRNTDHGPPPAPILANHHVQSLQRLAYDSGYWTGWNNSAFNHAGPPYGNSATTYDSTKCNPTDPLALIRPALTRLSVHGTPASHLHNAAGAASPLNAKPEPRPPPIQ